VGCFTFSWFVFGKCSLYAGGEISSVNIAGVCLVVLNLSKLEETMFWS